ncbi:hypothetical protein PEC301296_21090 [Pectobacterium carotovorum subsp. carotovorum]|nr:hypothetical protein GZ59_09300 [Pectobacterium atrosepticum]POW29959.1 hypothetical protein PB72LOC_01655 [Pectobacterium atrosepticum]GKV85797.1 hypothetical protein PEC301296_21090 [Pectobacterium carotovorum subsp. carotovorum]
MGTYSPMWPLMIFVFLFVVFIVLYCPIYFFICLLVPFKGFSVSYMKHRRRRYAVVHVSLFSRIGHLNKNQLKKFNTAFVSTLDAALQNKRESVIFRSHLMRTSQVQLAENVLSKCGRRYRVSTVALSRVERVGIICQTFLQEWRLVTIPHRGVMIVVMAR